MRISATTLESFRLYMEQDWMSEADLLATIRGEFTPTHEVSLGQAFGKVMETPARYRVPHGYSIIVNGETFTFSDATMAQPLQSVERDGIFEAKAEKHYGNRVVVSKADHLFGGILSEFKTTTSSFNFDKYAESYQWRFMVDAFQPQMVLYYVFELDDHGNSVIELRSINRFHLFPYDGLHDDCVDLLDRFCAYVIAKGLDGLLIDRQRKAEAVA